MPRRKRDKYEDLPLDEAEEARRADMAAWDAAHPVKEPERPQFILAPPEVRSLAEALVDSVHQRLQEATIVYGMEGKSHTRYGRTLHGRVFLLSPLDRWLEASKEDVSLGAEFVVLLDAREWDRHDGNWREAALDDLLAQCGCEVNEDGNRRYYKRGPDFQGDLGVLSRHGAWNEPLAQMGEMVRQLPLFEVPA